jgi:hypothetical protein
LAETCALLGEARGTFLKLAFVCQGHEDFFVIQVHAGLVEFYIQHLQLLRTTLKQIVDFSCFTKQQRAEEQSLLKLMKWEHEAEQEIIFFNCYY